MNDDSLPANIDTATDGAPERLSDLMQRLAQSAGPTITLRDISSAMDQRSLGAFLFVFSLPSVIPLPPGATLVLGLPLIFITWQIAIGRSRIWLPRSLSNYRIRKETFTRIVMRSTPWLRRLELLIRPRNWHLGERAGERVFGIYALFLAFAVVIPIPFGNWLPAVAIAIMSLAYTERDGNWMTAGAIVGVAGIVLATGIVLGTGAAISAVL